MPSPPNATGILLHAPMGTSQSVFCSHAWQPTAETRRFHSVLSIDGWIDCIIRVRYGRAGRRPPLEDAVRPLAPPEKGAVKSTALTRPIPTTLFYSPLNNECERRTVAHTRRNGERRTGERYVAYRRRRIVVDLLSGRSVVRRPEPGTGTQ